MRRIARAMVAFAVLPLFMLTAAWSAEPFVLSEVDPALRGLDTSREQNSAVRYRFVQLSGTALEERLVLNLFDDLEITAERMLERRQLDSTVWTGRVLDAPESWVVVATNASGATFAKVVVDGTIYQVRPRGRGIHSVLELDPDATPDLGPWDEVDDAVIPEIDFDKRRDASVEASESVCDEAYSCGALTIDIMIVYTSAARSSMGGSDASAQATIAAAVDEMNLAMGNTGVVHQYNLVHAALVGYAESGDAGADLTRLRSQTDGYMDEVHAWRDQYGADLVSLITSSGGCGIGYVGIDPVSFSDTWGFNCVRVDCLTGNLTLAHEVGHNMGLQHDWYVSTDDRPCDWHHGYVNQAAFGGTSSQRWRTVMAYNTQCSDAGFNCTRLPYYSNPELRRDGDPMGATRGAAQAADAAYALTRTACKVAAYRSAGPVGPHVSFTATPSSGLAPLAVSFDAAASSDDGFITSYSWDFDDGNTASGVSANHTFVVPGSYGVTLTVTDNDGMDDVATQTIEVTDPSAPVDHVAVAQQVVSGSVSGTYADTHTNNGVAETVTEVTNGGKPANRQSFMEVIWRFDVATGAAATLHANAWAPTSSDGDAFELAYSTDGSAFQAMFLIASTTDDNSVQTYPLGILPGSSVWVRLRDTVRTPGNSSKDRVALDHLFIRSQGGVTVPLAPSTLTATASSDTQVDMTWTDNSSDEDGFHIERSVNGGSWDLLTSVGAGVTSHSDAGLAPFTAYSYRVQAFHADGVSGYSNTASATTGGTLVTYHVGALTGSAMNDNRWAASATVTVHDEAHSPVEGAVVLAAWAGGSQGSDTATTDLNGNASFTKGGLKKGTKSIEFSVTDIQDTGAVYDSEQNDVVASITIVRGVNDRGTDMLAPDQRIPSQLSLSQNSPNPFNPSTTIHYGLPAASYVQLVIYDTQGRRVRTLVEARQNAGVHSARWDGRDQRGVQVATGIYIYRMKAGDTEVSKRMILLK